MATSKEKQAEHCDCCYCREKRRIEQMRELRLRQRLAFKGDCQSQESEDA